jgi:hypothetical protein
MGMRVPSGADFSNTADGHRQVPAAKGLHALYSTLRLSVGVYPAETLSNCGFQQGKSWAFLTRDWMWMRSFRMAATMAHL